MSLSLSGLTSPPYAVICAALEEARRSPCAKSKRGVAAFIAHPGSLSIVGKGFNSPPLSECTGTDACRAMCSNLCVHAEARAIRETIRVIDDPHDVELVHVKVDDRGDLVAGGPPSCWPCANLVVDAGIAAVWLYEDLYEGPGWTRWIGNLFLESTWRRQPAHPLYVPRPGIDVPCEECGSQHGAKRDHRGFWRCNFCGYPGQ